MLDTRLRLHLILIMCLRFCASEKRKDEGEEKNSYGSGKRLSLTTDHSIKTNLIECFVILLRNGIFVTTGTVVGFISIIFQNKSI